MDAMKEAIVKLLAFCRANYLQVNPKKSELLLMCGQVRRSSIAGIEFKYSAKYLGVKYNKSLNATVAFKDYSAKINFIFFRLYRLLKQSDCRTRYNLWQIFVLPLLRMPVSMIGVADSHRFREQVESVKKEMRCTLKKFMLLPRSSPSCIIDPMTNYDEAAIVRMVERWEEQSEGRTKQHMELEEHEFAGAEHELWEDKDPITSFNPQLVLCPGELVLL